MAMSLDPEMLEHRVTLPELVPKCDHPIPDLSSSHATGAVDDSRARPNELSRERRLDAAAEAAIEKAEAPPPEVDGEDYSVFTVGQRRALIMSGSFAAWFSPMSGTIYYPVLNSIAADLHVSASQITLTVTTYLIIQGLAPMMIAGFSDSAGRRPAYAICFSLYIAANLALSLQNNYIALLILRMLQAAGSSGTVALANGLVGDCITSAERGKYVAYASVGSVLAPTLSPILGGVIGQYAGWHWIFWFLLILSCVTFVPLALFLPETCRRIVADGSVPPPKLNMNISDYIRHRNRARKGIYPDPLKQEALRKNYKLSIPNPLATLKVVGDFESALILLPAGLALACFYGIYAGASNAFGTRYGFNDIKISLMFLPVGGGIIISTFTTGMLIDWNYRRHAKRLNFPAVKNRMTDLSNFPIEKVRLQVVLPLYYLGAAVIIGYGWTLDYKVSLAGPIIMLFLIGYSTAAAMQCLSILMVDIHPGQPATATAAVNVFRCLLGAATSAAVVPMTKAIGNGWCYTILASLFVASSVGLLASMKHGIKWRQAKKAKKEKYDQRRRDKRKAILIAASAMGV